ncbi:MAG: glycoside hydrolase family 36 protein [Terrimicrobiaceae bacterium]
METARNIASPWVERSGCQVLPGSAPLVIDEKLDGAWSRSSVRNIGTAPMHVPGVRLATFGLLPADAPIYGEGFQMLSQYRGTVSASVCLGWETDHGHYKIPQTTGGRTFYNLLHVRLGPGDHLLLAFASCHRFSGEFRLGERGEVWMDTEGLVLQPGETWDLEEFGVLRGSDPAALYAELAARLAQNHPPRDLSRIPTGWCSWYAFGSKVTDADIASNLEAIQRLKLPLSFVQIDDGFQAKTGDWFRWSDGFPQGLEPVIRRIRDAGLEPAIWLAPFIAEEGSEVLRDHPDWFVADDQGLPLASDKVTFGGWHSAPWYALDGTHPEVLRHLEALARTYRERFGCRYFKLDANFWGAMHGGKRHDRKATRIEAYRRGMAAFNRGAGGGSFVLGCNAPMWPSLGLVNGMRVSNDISRKWASISTLARQQFHRHWQHRHLWINDPDCICLDHGKRGGGAHDSQGATNLPPANSAEFHFHAAVILASGGTAISGDDLARIPPDMLALLRKLLPPAGGAAVFDGFDFCEGRMQSADGQEMRLLFNWDDAECERRVLLPRDHQPYLYWWDPGVSLSPEGRGTWCVSIPAHGCAVLVLRPAKES